MHWHRDDPKNPRFVDLYPDWKNDYLGQFARYANMTLFPETRNPNNEKGLKQRRVEPDIVLETYPDGTPILPPIAEHRLQTSKEAVMRAFMTLHWCMCLDSCLRVVLTARHDSLGLGHEGYSCCVG